MWYKIVASWLLLAIAAFPATAEILTVPGDHLTIQAAIVAASDGDEVLVAAGTYGPITIPNKVITIRSNSGPEVTTIDGVGDRAVTCSNGVGRDTVLHGFCITGGHLSGGFGGGMLADHASPSVINCIFKLNQAGIGGGFAAIGPSSNPLLVDCFFEGNATPGVGNAAAVYIAGAASIIGCSFDDNVSGNGGGAVMSDGVVMVRDCAFTGNTSLASRGGALYVTGGTMEALDCIFEGNTAVAGGAIFNEGGTLLVSDSFFCENTPDHIAGPYEDGGGNLFNEVCESPPVITCNEPMVLWPPNHRLVDITDVISVEDPDGDPVQLSIVALSDEPEIPEPGDGTGQHAPDFKNELFEGGRGLLARSERQGGGDGRFYLLVVTANDGIAGITTAVCVAAVVPHDQSQEALEAVITDAHVAAALVQIALENDLPLWPWLYEHGVSEEMGPWQ